MRKSREREWGNGERGRNGERKRFTPSPSLLFFAIFSLYFLIISPFSLSLHFFIFSPFSHAHAIFSLSISLFSLHFFILSPFLSLSPFPHFLSISSPFPHLLPISSPFSHSLAISSFPLSISLFFSISSPFSHSNFKLSFVDALLPIKDAF